MIKDEQTTENETLALLFVRAAELTREPLVFDDPETSETEIDN